MGYNDTLEYAMTFKEGCDHDPVIIMKSVPSSSAMDLTGYTFTLKLYNANPNLGGTIVSTAASAAIVNSGTSGAFQEIFRSSGLAGLLDASSSQYPKWFVLRATASSRVHKWSHGAIDLERSGTSTG